MPDTNTIFLTDQMKIIRAYRAEIIGAQISDKITLSARVPLHNRPGSIGPAEQALQFAQSLQPAGWRFSGFAFDDTHVTVDLSHDLVG